VKDNLGGHKGPGVRAVTEAARTPDFNPIDPPTGSG